MWKEKLGNYLIDISKYTLTAIFIASLFKDLEEMKWVVYGLSLFASASLLITGFNINKQKEGGQPMTGTIFMLLAMGVPCAIFLLWCLTPGGKKWLKANHLI